MGSSNIQSTVSMNKPGKASRTNVLTGASSTSYQRPVIWAGQYMGLVSYQVQKENDENEKRLQQLQDMAKSANFRRTQQKKEADTKSKATFSLPMRGRRLFIGEKTSEAQMRTEMLRYANMNEENNMATDHARWRDTVR